MEREVSIRDNTGPPESFETEVVEWYISLVRVTLPAATPVSTLTAPPHKPKPLLVPCPIASLLASPPLKP